MVIPALAMLARGGRDGGMLQGTQGQQRLSRKQPQLNCVKRKRSQKLEAIEQPVWRHWGAFGHRLRTWSMWWCRQRRTSARIPCRYWYWYWCWCWYWHAQREDESINALDDGGEGEKEENRSLVRMPQLFHGDIRPLKQSPNTSNTTRD